MMKTMSDLGAVPVQGTASELYDSLTRGTVDGALYNYIGLEHYDLEDMLKFSVDGPRFGGTAVTFVIGNRAWDDLPEDLKPVFLDAAAKAQQALCGWEEQNTIAVRERIVAENGHQVFAVSGEELARWEAPFPGVIDSWLADMASTGKDGAGILKAFRNAGDSQ